MKAILEFNLPEDRAELKYAQKGLDAILVIENVLSKIRECLKYGHDYKTADEVLESLLDVIHAELEDRTDRIEAE